ncbi:MAG: type IV secretion system DNA-binding domain-containing protein [Patescibacteria group bacterium]
MEEEIKEKPKLQSDITFFAETSFRGQGRRFGIKTDDRRRHMYIIGKTGMGKTNMMEQMVLADIYNGHGVGLVDPHGDFAEKILNYVPANRLNDIIYFNPADIDFPIGFNVLETIDPRHKHLVASGLMGVFKKIWPDVWSPRMEYILNNCLLALLDYPNSTLLGINRLLVDKEYRKRVIAQIQNPVVKTFWVDEYARYSERFATEAIAPIQNKVGQFLSSSIIRNIVAQVKSTINIRDIMDNKKILIMNLSKGRLGEDSSRLLGGMLITKIQLAAMERVDIPEDERNDFYMFVDEFQNFATESFANILSEARKYHLDLILAHQYIEQLDEKVAPAVFGNVGTIVCFRVGAEDAEFLAKEFAPDFTEEDLVNLGKYNAYMKLMIDGVASTPFSAQTFLPAFEPTGNLDKVIRVSRERYAKPREAIEDKIMRWSGLEGGEEEISEGVVISAPSVTPRSDATVSARASTIPTEKKKITRGGQRYPAVCGNCNKDTDAPFEPDGSRPVYCPECYKIMMNKKHQEEKAPIEKKQTTLASENEKEENKVVEKIIVPKETLSTPPPTIAPVEHFVKPGQHIVFDN